MPEDKNNATPDVLSSLNLMNYRLETLEKKLDMLSKELEKESDHGKQQNILNTINSLVEILEKNQNRLS